MSHSTPPSAQAIHSGLASAVVMLRLHDKPADPDGLRHRYANDNGGLETPEIIRLGREAGLKVRSVRSACARLASTPLPAIARLRNGDYVVLARASGEQVLVHDAANQTTTTQSLDEWERRWSGELILFTRRMSEALAGLGFGWRWFIAAGLRHKKLLGEVLLASFMLQIIGLLTPLFFQVMVDKVLVHQAITTLTVLAVAYGGVVIFDSLLSALRAYVLSHTTTRIDVLLGSQLFTHLMGLPLRYFQARRVGDTVARVRQLETLRQVLTGSTLTAIVDGVFTLVFLAVMLTYSVALTGLVLISIPIYALISLFVTPVLRVRSEEMFERGAENQAFLVERLTGIETVKSLAVEPRLRRQWEERLAALAGASFRAGNLAAWARECIGLVNKLTMLGVLVLGATLVMDGELTVGQLVAFNMLAGQVGGPILRLAGLWQDLQQARIAVERLGDILNTPVEPGSGADTSRMTLPDLAGAIRFEQVTFRYDPSRPPVLDGLTLEIPAGQSVGIVGPSGSGKSTLAKLLQRLYLPEGGRVLVDGVDCATIDPAWLRRRIGVVPQDDMLFTGSVRDNIALTDPAMAVDRILLAARLAGAHDFIARLPQGYDSVVGERGTALSGGQRQRLAIARALATDPRILVLDEATSALDVDSEKAIRNNLERIKAGRTMVIIAHRLSTVLDCDRILVLVEGCIVEDGAPKALLAKGGVFAGMMRGQG